MTTVLTKFDGKVFVPEQPVDLPVGAEVSVTIPSASGLPPTRPFSPEEDRDWEQILAQIRGGEPDPPTADEAMRKIRMRP